MKALPRTILMQGRCPLGAGRTQSVQSPPEMYFPLVTSDAAKADVMPSCMRKTMDVGEEG